jgi:hypothetical protein
VGSVESVGSVGSVGGNNNEKIKMGQVESGKKHFKTHEDLAIYQLAFDKLRRT